MSALAVIELSIGDLCLASLLVLLNAGVSIVLKLDLGRRLLIAAVRATLQLALLGLLLHWIFDVEGPWAVIPWMLGMALIAGIEAVRRTSRRVPGIWAASMGVMLVSSLAVTFYCMTAVIDVDGAWYTPRYAIPILGMILGNTLNGISLGLETSLEGFALERERVEMLLAHGASRREASLEVVRRSVRRGMVPILNSMIAVGVIAIPGMMTGQMLAGEDPAAAARYQLFILFAIAGGVALGTVGVVLCSVRLVFDERDRLRMDRVRSVEPR